MLHTSLILKIICLLAFCHSLNIPAMQMWNFEFISVESNSSDETRLKYDIKAKRISRGLYGLNGTILVNMDIQEGDNMMIEASMQRSLTGGSEYQPTPFSIKKQHIYDFLNSFYKDVVMNSLSNCSDLPVFKDKFQPPLKKNYALKNCRISNDALTPILAEGFYKILVIGSGKIDYAVKYLAKVERNN